MPNLSAPNKVILPIKLILLSGLLLGMWLALFVWPGSAAAQSCTPYPTPQLRFGFNYDLATGDSITNYATSSLNARWYLDYTYQRTPTVPNELSYAQMIRTATWLGGNYTNSVTAAVLANPGSLWILGNEPDRHGQDGVTPEKFATFYHDLYTLIKQSDSSARVAVGAVVQGTPIRLRYLTMVLAAYQSQYGGQLPTDAWTVHGFILQECNVAGCWGASIPPGLEAFANEGKIYQINDHGRLSIFRQQLIDFRRWMQSNGYKEYPLLVTEYGILFPPQLGFTDAVVRSYMTGSFDFLLTTTDPQLGYAADDNRLVQAWSWFSLNVPPYDTSTKQGFNGNLFDPKTKQITSLGLDFAAYINNIRKADYDVGVAIASLTPPTQLITAPVTTTLALDLRNLGSWGVSDLVVDVALQAANGGAPQLVKQTTLSSLAAGCGQSLAVELNLQPIITTTQLYTLTVNLRSNIQDREGNLANNQATGSLAVLDVPLSFYSYLPIAGR